MLSRSELFSSVDDNTAAIFFVLLNINSDMYSVYKLHPVVCFLLGNSPASEFYMPTFRNTLFHLHRQVGVKND